MPARAGREPAGGAPRGVPPGAGTTEAAAGRPPPNRRPPHGWGLVLLLAGLTACSGDNGGGVAQPTAIIGGWPQSERVQTIRQQLHAAGSGAQARALFPDLRLTYVDDGRGKPYQEKILPFSYYWSPSGRVTINICAVERTVFICPYYLENVPGDLHDCDVADIYTEPDHVPPVDR